MNRRTERQDITTQTERIGVCPFVLGSASAMLIMMTMLLLIFRPLGLGLVNLDQVDLRVLLTGQITGVTMMIALIATVLHTFGV